MEPVLAQNRVLTLPNLLSAVRLALIPVFVYLMLVAHTHSWAVAILMFSGFSDWADGKIARVLNQSSRLGVLLDPAVDRLYMITVPIVFALGGIAPWWFVLTLLARDAAPGRDAAVVVEPRTLRTARFLCGQGRHVRPDVGLPAGPVGSVRRAVEPHCGRLRVGVFALGFVHVPVGVRALHGADGRW